MPSDPPTELPKDPPTEEQAGATAEVSPAKEWGAAVVLMILFALISAAFVSIFRG